MILYSKLKNKNKEEYRERNNLLLFNLITGRLNV